MNKTFAVPFKLIQQLSTSFLFRFFRVDILTITAGRNDDAIFENVDFIWLNWSRTKIIYFADGVAIARVLSCSVDSIKRVCLQFVESSRKHFLSHFSLMFYKNMRTRQKSTFNLSNWPLQATMKDESCRSYRKQITNKKCGKNGIKLNLWQS